MYVSTTQYVLKGRFREWDFYTDKQPTNEGKCFSFAEGRGGGGEGGFTEKIPPLAESLKSITGSLKLKLDEFQLLDVINLFQYHVPIIWYPPCPHYLDPHSLVLKILYSALSFLYVLFQSENKPKSFKTRCAELENNSEV